MTNGIEHLERRVAQLDVELAAVRTELRALRHPAAPPPPPLMPSWFEPEGAPEQPAPPSPAAPVFASHAALMQADLSAGKPRRGGLALEDLLAGRVMAWVGGSAVLVGLILFLAMAVSRGWIGEEERTLMAGVASLLLIGGGARAYERRGRTEAAVAATAAGVAGGFATLAVATEVYALIPPLAGLAAGIALGGVGAGLALRWISPTMGILGIAGALLSPVLVGADLADAITVGLLAAAYAGAVCVCVALGWSWLGALAFLIVAPQWSEYLAEHPSLAVVVAFGILGALSAVGGALRTRTGGDPLPNLLLAANAAITAAGGWLVLDGGDLLDARLWLAGLAVLHLAGGLVLLHARREAVTLALTALGIAVTLADLALAELASGLVLPLVWAASVVGFAWLVRLDRTALLPLFGHLALAVGHVLGVEAPVEDLGGGGSAAGLAGAATIAAACVLSARLVTGQVRVAIEVTGLLALAYATGLAFDGGPLAAALAAEAALIGAVARRRGPDALLAAWTFLGGAATVALALLAPPQALAGAGVDDLGGAVLALLAIAAAAPVVSRTQEGWFACGAALLYLASVVVVTAIDGQSGQFALSALWGVVGFGALLAGVLADHPPLRAVALGLLALTAGKVFVADLASLDSLARVGSFLVLGTLLLAGAFAWQRARPAGGGEIESAP